MDEPQEGTGRRSRKRSGRGNRRKTRVAEEESTIVTKDDSAKPVAAPAVAPVQKSPAVPPKVVIAPPKKKPVKVMLVPKGKVAVPKIVKNRTFTAKSIKVTIDNTARTRKNRADALAKVDAMTDDQIRAAAVQARLSRRETVGKAPIGLLRQMVKDYQIMKGRLQ